VCDPGVVLRDAGIIRVRLPPPPTGADKTTLVLYQRDDHPGGLMEMLEQFAVRGVNLTRLESRPTGLLMGPRGQMVVLMKRRLMLLDAQNPLQLRTRWSPLTLANG